MLQCFQSALTIRLSCIIVVAIIRILNLFLSFANYQRIKMSIMLNIILPHILPLHFNPLFIELPHQLTLFKLTFCDLFLWIYICIVYNARVNIKIILNLHSICDIINSTTSASCCHCYCYCCCDCNLKLI